MHLLEQWREGGDVAFAVAECVGCVEVFVAARAPEAAVRVDHK